MQKYIIIFLFIFSSACLKADLVWSKEEGWQPTAISLEKFDDEPYEAMQLMNEARSAQEDGRQGIALSKYKIVCRKFPDSMFAPEAYFQIGEIKIGKNQFNDAFKAFSTIIQKYPEYPHFNNVLKREFEIASLLKSGERPKYFGLIPGFRDYTATINFYKKIIDEAPSSEIAPLALTNIGELALSKNKTIDAIAAFEQLIDDYPYSEYSPMAYFHLGEIHSKIIKSPLYDQGATKLAINYYEDFLTLYPDHELAPKAQAEHDKMKTRLAQSKLLIGDFYFNARNNWKAAVIMYRRAEKTLPNSEIANEAEDKIQNIKAGILPKKTPVDFLFGRYQRPTDEQLDNDEVAENTEREKFDFESDFININTEDNSNVNLANPSRQRPDESFLEVGPNVKF